MKLVIAIVQDSDASKLVKKLNEENFMSTKLASTGGFLKQGNTTLMIGCSEVHVESVLKIIKDNCSEIEVEELTSRASMDLYSMGQIKVGGATVFVIPVDSFHSF